MAQDSSDLLDSPVQVVVHHHGVEARRKGLLGIGKSKEHTRDAMEKTLANIARLTEQSRGLLVACMGLGSLMIIAMSAWLNASALAGAAAMPSAVEILYSLTRS